MRFAGLVDDPALYWWVIADYQSPAIHDATLALTPGKAIDVPPSVELFRRIGEE